MTSINPRITSVLGRLVPTGNRIGYLPNNIACFLLRLCWHEIMRKPDDPVTYILINIAHGLLENELTNFILFCDLLNDVFCVRYRLEPEVTRVQYHRII
jgi:hypothetical protein